MSGPAAPRLPRDARALLCFAIALVVLAVAAAVAYVPLGLDVSPRVWRAGTAQVHSCVRAVVPVSYRCTATVEWHRIAVPDDAPVQPGPVYQVVSRTELRGSVEVEGHPRHNARQTVVGEAIVPTGQPTRQSALSTVALFVVVVGAAVAVAVAASTVLRWRDSRRARG